MRARPFLAVVLAMVLILAGLGLAGWLLVWRLSPLQLQHRPLEVPAAARFVPRQVPLSLFLLADAEEPVAYARAVAPPRQRRQAAAAVERLREGAFAAAGLDYSGELRSWIGPGIALALFEAGPGEGHDFGGWLLALQGRDGDGARRFLQRFWQMRSLAGTDLQISSYRGLGLISGRGALLGRDPMPLATALIGDDLVLIASGRGVLEQALDVSQIDELNLASQPRFAEVLRQFGQGAMVVVARPPALRTRLALPLPDGQQEEPRQVFAALHPEGRDLVLEARLDLSSPPPPLTPRAALAALGGPGTVITSLALVEDPAALLRIPFLEPLLRHAADLGDPPAGSPDSETGPSLPVLVAAADSGPLLAARGPGGWLLGTEAAAPSPSDLAPDLEAAGLIDAALSLEGRPLQVWTRLRLESAAAKRRPTQSAAPRLEAPLWGARLVVDGQAWWGQSLGALAEQARLGPGARASGSARSLRAQLERLGHAEAPLRWTLATDQTVELLAAWRPWSLLATLAGGPFEVPVRGFAMAVQPDEAGLRVDGRLLVQ